MVKLQLIVAKGRNNVIGKENTLIWDVREDLLHFRKMTENKSIVMGRKTYESIGRPLPKRKNIVLTSNPDLYATHNVTTVSSVEDVLNSAKEEKTVIIGGSEIYKQFLPYCDELLVTEINQDFEGDSYFPEIDLSIWEKVDSEKGEFSGIVHEKNPEGLEYTFVQYLKK